VSKKIHTIPFTNKLHRKVDLTIDTNHIYVKNVEFELGLVKYKGTPNYKQLFVNKDYCTTGKQFKKYSCW
jgi:hypothetical protein